MRIFVYEQFPNEKTPLGFTKKQVLMEGIYDDGGRDFSPIELYNSFRKNHSNWPKPLFSFRISWRKYILSTENENIWAEVFE